jgi:hypothetical protein
MSGDPGGLGFVDDGLSSDFGHVEEGVVRR